MTVAIAVVVALVAVSLIAVGALRWRKYRRDERRLSSSGTLLGPPPSPYQPAKRFRLLDGETPTPHHEPAPLRLEASHEYVFGEAELSSPEEPASIGPHRHDVQWALNRSAHRSPFAYHRRLIVVALVVVALIVGALLVARHPWSKTPSQSGAPVTHAALASPPWSITPGSLTVTRLDRG